MTGLRMVDTLYERAFRHRTRLEQQGICAICGRWFEHLCTDHDHETGLFRAHICSSCDTGMGYVDKPGWVEKALKYKETYTRMAESDPFVTHDASTRLYK